LAPRTETLRSPGFQIGRRNWTRRVAARAAEHGASRRRTPRPPPPWTGSIGRFAGTARAESKRRGGWTRPTSQPLHRGLRVESPPVGGQLGTGRGDEHPPGWMPRLLRTARARSDTTSFVQLGPRGSGPEELEAGTRGSARVDDQHAAGAGAASWRKESDAFDDRFPRRAPPSRVEGFSVDDRSPGWLRRRTRRTGRNQAVRASGSSHVVVTFRRW